MKRRVQLALVVVLLFGGGSALAQLLYQDKIEALTTYKWSKRQIPVENRANHIRFVRAVNHEMERRGYVQDTVKPDMEILFDVNVAKKLESETTTSRSWDPSNVRTNLKFDFYQEGTLHIEVYQLETYRLLWSAKGRRRVSTPDRAEKEINQAVSWLFGKFPVGPKEDEKKK